MKKYITKLLLAVTILHLTACSLSTKPVTQSSKPQITESFTLSSRQTHLTLTRWEKQKNEGRFTQKNIIFENRHPYAKSIHHIISGFNVATFSRRSKGIGLPVIVQTERSKFAKITENAFLSNVHPGTLVIEQKVNGKLKVTLLDPRSTKQLNGVDIVRQEKLVIDHITNDPDNKRLSLRGLLNPLELGHLQGFYLSQPYDKNKIPIVMVHGIFSSPETFIEMAETIEAQPDLYKKYQIWHYYYPTGTPWLATAHNFRTSFRRLIKTFDPSGTHPNIQKTTIIAHSMGGLITRLSLSHPGKNLSKSYLGEAGLKLLNREQYEKLHPYFHYEPLSEPEQVIFLAVPHKGSKLASGFVGWATNKLIAIPNILIKETLEVLIPREQTTLPEQTQKLLTKGESAVNQLEPKNPALEALNQMKLPNKLKVHSIIGDAGFLGSRFYTDGVVSYKSSTLGKVGTEKVICSSHEITDNPHAIKRVIEILRTK